MTRNESAEYGCCAQCIYWQRTGQDEQARYGQCMVSPPRLFEGIKEHAPPIGTNDAFGLRPEHFYRPITYEGNVCIHFHQEGD